MPGQAAFHALTRSGEAGGSPSSPTPATPPPALRQLDPQGGGRRRLDILVFNQWVEGRPSAPIWKPWNT